MKKPQPDSRLRRRSEPTTPIVGPIAWAFLLVAMTALAYIPAVRGGFIWDDDLWVTGNQLLRSTDGLQQIWFKIGSFPQYYPLVLSSFWIENHLWAFNPLGYHTVNLVLHTIGALLLWRLLTRLDVPGAWLAAAVFAIHPVHVESVAWVTERKNVLSGVFYLAAAIAYLRFALDPGEQAPRRTRLRWYTAALFLFLAALLSKTVTGSLPAAILLVLWWKRGRIHRADVYPLIPFFLVAIALGMVTAAMERHHVGAVGSEWDLSPIDRCLIAGRALWFYAAKLLWPAPLTFIYPRWVVSSAVWWQYLFPAAALAVVIILWLARHRIGRGPLVAVLFFAGTLLPALGFLNVYPMRFSFVADHFQYLASIGLIVLAIAAAGRATQQLIASPEPSRIPPKAPGIRPHPAIVPVLAGVLLAALGVLTWRQGHAYAGLEPLWQDTLSKNPNAWMAHHNLGVIRAKQGRNEEAIEHCTLALRISPDIPEAYCTRGSAYRAMGDQDRAMADFNYAIAHWPSYPDTYYDRAITYAKSGQFELAIADYSKTLEFDPRYGEAYQNRGVAWSNIGDYDRAIADLTKAIELIPNSVRAYNNRGNAYGRKQQYDSAIRDYTRAIAINPGYAPAYYNRGAALQAMGKPGQAIQDYDRALAIEPGDATALFSRANAYRDMGRYPQAIHDFSSAIQLRPDFAAAYSNRATAYDAMGQHEQAIGDATKAIELQPKLASAYANRAIAYYQLKDYQKAWSDVRTCRSLGGSPNPAFLKELSKATSQAE